MAKRCTPCLSARVKRAILDNLKDADLIPLLDDIPECRSGPKIQMCGAGAKRARSAYQQFISECMKAKNIKGFGAAAPAMKECAAEWRTRKG